MLFWTGFSKTPSFKISMSGRLGFGRAGGRPQLTLFQSYMFTLILQWIAFIFGRDEEEDQ